MVRARGLCSVWAHFDNRDMVSLGLPVPLRATSSQGDGDVPPNLYFYRTFPHKQGEEGIMKEGSVEAPSSLHIAECFSTVSPIEALCRTSHHHNPVLLLEQIQMPGHSNRTTTQQAARPSARCNTAQAPCVQHIENLRLLGQTLCHLSRQAVSDGDGREGNQ